MSFIIQCECGQQMTVEDSHVGMDVMCVNCRRTIRVPPRPLDPSAVAMAGPVPGAGGGGPEPQSQGGHFPPPGTIIAPPGYGGGSWYKPHRGVLIVVLGALSCIGCCCCSGLWAGLPAIILGVTDLNEMKAGKMDPSGQLLTQIGIVLGAIGLGLFVLSIFYQAILPFGMHRMGPDMFPRSL